MINNVNDISSSGTGSICFTSSTDCDMAMTDSELHHQHHCMDEAIPKAMENEQLEADCLASSGMDLGLLEVNNVNDWSPPRPTRPRPTCVPVKPMKKCYGSARLDGLNNRKRISYYHKHKLARHSPISDSDDGDGEVSDVEDFVFTPKKRKRNCLRRQGTGIGRRKPWWVGESVEKSAHNHLPPNSPAGTCTQLPLELQDDNSYSGRTSSVCQTSDDEVALTVTDHSCVNMPTSISPPCKSHQSESLASSGISGSATDSSDSHGVLTTSTCVTDSSCTDMTCDDITNTDSDIDNSEINEHSSCTDMTCDDITNTDSDIDNSEINEQRLSADSSDEENAEHYRDVPLYPECGHTRFSLYTALMLLNIKHSCSLALLSDVLELIATLVPKNRAKAVASSVYKIKQDLKRFVGYEEPTLHYFCEGCQKEVTSSNRLCSCTTNGKILEYASLNVDRQIKGLFRDEKFSELVMQPKDPTLGELKDITDGHVYKNISESFGRDGQTVHLTFTMNTDGVAVFSSSKKGNLWPVYLAVNELPVQLRFSKKYIIPCSLYCQIEKPNMLTYLTPLMRTFKLFQDEGLQVRTPSGKKTFKGHLLIACLDLPARAIVVNMKQFNGRFGCNLCFDEGQQDPQNTKRIHYPFNERNKMRTHLSMLEDARKAVRNNTAERGIKGASALSLLRDVDLPNAFPADWMHCALLGVVKALLKFWLNTKNRKKKEFYIGDKIAILEKRLKTIRIPDFVARRQRSLSECPHWKATECREWLVHFSVPVVGGILPDGAFIHYCLLVSGLCLLAKDGVTDDDMTYAETLILDFCRMYPSIYGEQSQTMNIHLLRHLPHFVRLYGPLYNFSCFGFESMNCHLKRMVHGSRHVNSQIAFAVGMTKALPSVLHHITGKLEDPRVLTLFRKLTSRLNLDQREVDETGTVLGKGTPLSSSYRKAVELVIGAPATEDALQYSRYKKTYCFTTADYRKEKKTRDNSIVTFQKGSDTTTSCGQIECFVKCGVNTYAVIKEFTDIGSAVGIPGSVKVNFRKFSNTILCGHIKKMVASDHLCVVPGSDLRKKCISTLIGVDMFVSEPPNMLEHN